MERRILRLPQAIDAIARHLPKPEVRSCTLDRCFGKYAAADLSAPQDLPTEPRAARDAFVVAPSASAGTFRVTGSYGPADSPPRQPAGDEAFRVERGTPVDTEAWAVPVEDARLVGTKSVHLPAPHQGLINGPGTVLRRGQRIVRQGELITERTWALLRSCDVAAVDIVQTPTVHIVAVGSELGSDGFPEVSGRFLVHFLEALRIPAAFLGVVPDQEERIREEVKNGIPGGILLVTGGTGPGLTDRTIMAIRPAQIRLLCEGIALSPGSSTALAVGRNGVCVFLPGAPEAVLAVAYALLKPAVASWLGLAWPIWSRSARRALAEPWTGPADRFVLVAAAPGEGPLRISQSSGTGGLLGADRLVLLPPGEDVRTQGVVVGP